MTCIFIKFSVSQLAAVLCNTRNVMYSLHCYALWNDSKTTPEQKSTHPDFTIGWEQLINQWNTVNVRQVHKLHKRARVMAKCAPIPHTLRADAWFTISGAVALSKKNPGLYHKLYSVRCRDTATSALIEKDLPRTRIHYYHKQKRSSISLHALRRILFAYCNFDRTLGYCQGMNYIAGFLLYIFNETDEAHAFWTFVVIMRQIRSLFMKGLPGFTKLMDYFLPLCKHHVPSVYAVWESLGLDVFRLIFSKWFHSLFTYPSFEIDCEQIAWIWDLFLTRDFSVFVKVAFTIIAANKRELKGMDLGETIQFCTNLTCMKYNAQELIQKSLCVRLNEKYLQYTRDLTRFDWQVNKSLKRKDTDDDEKEKGNQTSPSRSVSLSSSDSVSVVSSVSVLDNV
eukprot:57590_1